MTLMMGGDENDGHAVDHDGDDNDRSLTKN